MPVESAEDLAGFFDPDEFADPLPMIATIGGEAVPFDGIFTEGHLAEQPGSTPDITVTVPRVIVAKSAVPGIQQGDQIERSNGDIWLVADIHHKRDLLILHLQEPW